MESANKLVVQSRMKGAGMRWEPGHVNAMLALRNLACNDRWVEGWQAIRQSWQQERQAKRALRACPPSLKTEGEPSALPAATIQTRPSSPAKRPPGVGTTAKSQTAPAPTGSAGSQRTRPAASHPWRRPFLSRRSA